MRVLSLLDHVRAEVLRDTASPQLFSSDGLLLYLNEGYGLIARHTHCFRDEQPLDTVATQRMYDLPAHTVQVYQVWRDERPLENFTRRQCPPRIDGPPKAYSTDGITDKMVLHPVPDAVYSLTLHRAYTPASLTLASSIELPDEWALSLGDWIAYRALRNNDPDGSDTVAARGFYDSWRLSLLEIKRAVFSENLGARPSAQPIAWI